VRGILWLFQLLKLLPGSIASLTAVSLPGLILAGLIVLPFFDRTDSGRARRSWRAIGGVLFAFSAVLVVGLTISSYLQDSRDPIARAQLALQAAEEQAFRTAPFTPATARADESGAEQTDTGSSGANSTSSAHPRSPSDPPEAYVKNCAICHGTHGEGFSVFPKLIGVADKPRRTVEDIIAITNDPASYGLKPPMKSFADKLTDTEKRETAEWIVTLKKKP
jgi:mono/diheme cytochrome c family protein